MAADAEEQEPSIEEILASIRQIISDDDEEGAEEAAESSAPAEELEAEAPPEPEPEAEEGDDVLELTDVVEECGEKDPEPEPEPEEEFVVEEKVEIDMQDRDDSGLDDSDIKESAEPENNNDFEDDLLDAAADSLLTNNAEKATMDGFSALLGNIAVERGGRMGSITLEDIVRELMRPMLRDWLDQNLPPLIEKLVQKELQRLANKVMDE